MGLLRQQWLIPSLFVVQEWSVKTKIPRDLLLNPRWFCVKSPVGYTPLTYGHGAYFFDKKI